MTMLQTAGTHSCSSIAIGDFKTGKGDQSSKEWNETYRKSGSLVHDKTFYGDTDGLSVQEFRDDILYPTEQALGRTRQYCFDQLMDMIDQTDLRDKYITANLTGYQKSANFEYWHNRLLDRGFDLIDQTYNNWGDLCYIYSRNNNRNGLNDEDYYGLNDEDY